ncbi:Cytochrome c heme lyase subunit CcmF [hydrothermal vent metagenome]|uniref:Cytochrome c heme lyase subunit CcmF n=1 Tax=hydrothermal vent metagenome TaxID=652676 RepID=A0A1W1CVL1_9ZZZZ
MLIEIGHIALILTLVFISLQIILPSIGLYRHQNNLILLAKPLLWASFFWVWVAFAILMNGFLTDDFSILYVASNSNTQLPLLYKITALWGAHEGSVLFWLNILISWSLAVSIFSKRIPTRVITQIIIVLGLISLGFVLFILFTSNPFERLSPIPLEGRELNPLLQDFGLAIHPPMLYMGYVGMAVPFAFVLSALIQGKLDSTWLKWSRPWTLIAWAFLTIGIVLGSWWAYYELGWGGWWFWDPVENASFMPWLVATALVHSLIVSQKRGAFKHWTVLLAILGFSLSLLGTFLVRSGVLTSVHSFATDPGRGVFILIFLVIAIGGSFSLYAWRANKLTKNNSFGTFSRESGLLLNNIFLVIAMATVLLGTLYPLLLDALGLGKISVGAPYFQTVFVPIMIPAIFMMVVVPFMRWKTDNLNRLTKQLNYVWLSILLIGIGFSFVFYQEISVVLALFLFSWIMIHSIYLLTQRIKQQQKIDLSFIGMIVAHIGIAIFLLGATVTTKYGIEKDVSIAINKSFKLNNYQLILKKIENTQGENWHGTQAVLDLYENNQKIDILIPQKRQYSSGMPMTEAAINAGLTRDIYVALGEDLKNGSWSFRIYHKPLIRLIWLGGLLIALGALFAAFNNFYRKEK